MSPARAPEKMPGALSRGAARVMGSRFAKPVARVVLVAAGLVLLAVIGRASAAGAFGGGAAAPPTVVGSSEFDRMAPPSSAAPLATAGAAPLATAETAPAVAAAPAQATHAAQGPASADDPVILNTALADELRRLPGIGAKRADAIVALRTRLGRFRAIEDLLKVKGIGRAMLKRLRPLVRLDGPVVRLVPPVPESPTTDSGAPPAKG
jgi:competence protein ComEA